MTQQRHESPDVGKAVVRMLRGLVRRAADGDTEALEWLATCERAASVATTVGLDRARREGGYSYGQLADVTGTTRQAVLQRVGRLDKSPAELRRYLSE